jgi:hypothetical protein
MIGMEIQLRNRLGRSQRHRQLQLCIPLVLSTSAWWTMRSIIAAATAWSPKTAPQPLKGRLKLPPTRGGIDYKESHAREAEEVRR